MEYCQIWQSLVNGHAKTSVALVIIVVVNFNKLLKLSMYPENNKIQQYQSLQFSTGCDYFSNAGVAVSVLHLILKCKTSITNMRFVTLSLQFKLTMSTCPVIPIGLKTTCPHSSSQNKPLHIINMLACTSINTKMEFLIVKSLNQLPILACMQFLCSL